MSESTAPPLTLQELPEIRRKTEAISQFLREQITTHLETLRPLLAPERIFGKLAGGKTEVPGADSALAELKQLCRPFTSKPYDIPSEFDANWLALVGNALEISPWEYTHPVDGKIITISSPVRWIMGFRSNYTVSHLKNVLAGKEAPRPEFLRQVVVNALVLQLVLSRTPGLAPLFADLRYDLKTEKAADLAGLPVVTITSCLTSFRPPNDVLLAVTGFSGIAAFIELVDLDAVEKPKDVLKEKLEERLRG